MAIDKNIKYELLKDDRYLLMKETACRSEQLQAYFGGEKYVLEVFRRFEEMFPERGVNQIPYLRDGVEVGPTEDIPSAVKRETEHLARSVFPEMPFNDSYKALLFLNENLERIGGIQYRSYSGCVIDRESHVIVPEGSVDMGHFQMNGKTVVVRECSSMYDNNVIIGGESIMKFGPYCRLGILSIPDTSHSGDKYDVCVIHSSHGMSGVDKSKTYDVFSDGGDVLIPLVENAQVLTEHGELRVVKGGKEYDYSIPMLKDMAAKLRAGRLDKLEAEGVGRYFHIVNIQRAYDRSVKTDEVISGRFAEDFAGKVSWSRALDMDLKDFPDVRGIRYIDFKDCTNVHVLFKDGKSLLTDLASPKLLKAISAKVDEMRQSPKRQLKSGSNKIK